MQLTCEANQSERHEEGRRRTNNFWAIAAIVATYVGSSASSKLWADGRRVTALEEGRKAEDGNGAKVENEGDNLGELHGVGFEEVFLGEVEFCVLE